MKYNFKIQIFILSLVLCISFYSCNDSINSNPKREFSVAQSFLNDSKNYELAITHFKKIFKNHPNSQEAKKSLFMIGYIYNNNLQALS